MRADGRLPHVLPLVALAAALACSPGASPPGDGDSQVIARVGGEEITRAELDAWIKDEWFRDQIEDRSAARVHEFRSEQLERMIDERLVEQEARARGVSPEELLRQQAGNATVSDEEVTQFYEDNRARLGEATRDQVAPRIRQHLAQRKAQDELQGFVEGLRREADVAVTFEAPRTEVAAVGPALGPASAPVTIVEFSDFQCPFCSRTAPVIKELRERYPDRVRIVYRHFPLDSIHPRARAAAEASLCADEQDRFWDYHDLLFANADALGDEQLVGYAEQLGLDTEAFRGCFDERRYRDEVERDLEAGRRAGVSGTPSFFVNGRFLGGAQPVEDFVELIESELQEGGTTSAS